MSGATPPAARAPARTGRAALLAWPLVFFGLAAALQLWQPAPWDSDTAYHVAVARLLRAHGVLRSFPWTPYSWLADHYADKELLFHLLLAPLAGLDWVVAARVLGTALGGALLCVLWLLLRRERVPWAGVWTLAAPAASGYFAMRLALVRPHLLSIALALAVTWAASRRRLAVLGVAGVLYPLSYVAWPLALVLLGLVELAHVLSGARPSCRAPAAGVAGIGLGLLLHPNFPEVLRTTWLVNVRILLATAWAGRTGFSLGTEFRPFDAAGFLRHASLPLLFSVAAAGLAWKRRRGDPVPLCFGLAALAFAALAAGSQRFVEYLAPFSTAALALAGRDLARPRLLAGATAAGAVAFTALAGREPLELMRLRTLDFPPELETALRARVPAGAQVFTCGWLTTGEMMLALPERRFIVALDPVLFHEKDPGLYRTWFDLVHRPPQDPARVVREAFGARFALCESRQPEYFPFLRALLADPRARLVVQSPLWLLFEIGNP